MFSEKSNKLLKHNGRFYERSCRLYHMELYGKAVAVNPEPELAGIAQQRDWKTLIGFRNLKLYSMTDKVL